MFQNRSQLFAHPSRLITHNAISLAAT